MQLARDIYQLGVERLRERREGREERERGERWREERRGRRKVRQRCDKIQMFNKPPTLMSGRRTLSVNV